uniref:Sodium channel blocker AbNaTx8 n=1 Tax=Androctonus bicolor TaxID=748906 RepID=A0A0K0LBX4_9SCOR|nr:sodium channel blocker AbNaTx8 [Androctonus bicolor]
MRAALLLAFSSLILTGVLTKKSGYPTQHDGCKIWCVFNHFCSNYCETYGGSGYCYTWKLACWCDNIHDWVPTWSYATNKCRAK